MNSKIEVCELLFAVAWTSQGEFVSVSPSNSVLIFGPNWPVHCMQDLAPGGCCSRPPTCQNEYPGSRKVTQQLMGEMKSITQIPH